MNLTFIDLGDSAGILENLLEDGRSAVIHVQCGDREGLTFEAVVLIRQLGIVAPPTRRSRGAHGRRGGRRTTSAACSIQEVCGKKFLLQHEAYTTTRGASSTSECPSAHRTC